MNYDGLILLILICDRIFDLKNCHQSQIVKQFKSQNFSHKYKYFIEV